MVKPLLKILYIGHLGPFTNVYSYKNTVSYEIVLFYVLTARDGAPCVFGGNVYRSGESFQSSCKYQCTCLDGAIGCVPLCGMDVRLPSEDCPMPRRVKVPGKCCEEWVCDSPTTNTFVGPALPGKTPYLNFNLIELNVCFSHVSEENDRL